MLDGYTAIRYGMALPYAGSWYTDDITLIFVKKGTLNICYGNSSFQIDAGQIGLVRKDLLLEYLFSSAPLQQPLEYFQFTVKADLVKEFTKLTAICPSVPEKSEAVIVRNSTPAWLSYIESLAPYLDNEKLPASGLIRIKLMELFFHLSCIDGCMLRQLLDVREHYRANITATVEENVMNSLSVHQLAELSGRSISSFRRDFSAIYNMPPSQWIRLKRLEKARELLLGTTMTVTDICYTLGFEHIAHFSKLFKTHFGKSPLEYKSRQPVA